MSVITICSIRCPCEQGAIFKTAITDTDGKPAMFAIVRGQDDEGHFNTIVFDGYCSQCGKRYQHAVLIESLLKYKEV